MLGEILNRNNPSTKPARHSRRARLLSAGTLTVALIAAACGSSAATGTPEATKSPEGTTPTPVSTPTIKPSMAVGTLEPTPGASSSLGECAITQEGLNINPSDMLTGIPASVDASTVDQSNHKPFSHEIGLGSQMILGEPGGLLVGPDFDPKKVASSQGMIQYLSGENQHVINTTDPFYQNVPEGGFIYASLMEGVITVGDGDGQKKIVLPEVPDNNYLVFVKGLYPNQNPDTQNTDRNQTAIITCAVPGHALVEEYKSGTKTNMAFISEGQFKQLVTMSENGGTNLGAGGASRTTAIFLDLNTGAFAVMTKEAGHDQDPSKGWVALGSNWWNEQIAQRVNNSTNSAVVSADLSTRAYTASRKADISQIRASQVQNSYQGFVKVGTWKR